MNKHLISFAAFVLCAALSAFQLWLWQGAVHEHLARMGELDLQLGRAGLACGLFFLCLLGIVQSTRLWWRLMKAPAPDSYEALRASRAAMFAANHQADEAEVNEDADADTAMAEISHPETPPVRPAAAPVPAAVFVTAAQPKTKSTARQPLLQDADWRGKPAKPQRPPLTRYEKLEKRWWR